LAFTGINAPALTSDSAAIVAGAIRWGPGPMPSFPGSVLSDQQVDSIVKYIQFVQHPPSPGGSPMNWYGPVAEGFAAWVILFALIFVAGWIEKGGNG
jgi:ubiquinol-cytochrome c reductase cytochrome c subunit